MPLEFASEPTMGASLVHDGMAQALGRRSPLSNQGIAIEELEVGQPHMIYDLRADEIARGGGLESAHPTGYRYLVHTSAGPVAAGEVLADEHGQATLVANLNYGRFVQATTDALAKLEALPEVRAGSYEVRLLRFSSVYLLAIWLKSQQPGPDIIFPLAPAPPPLEAERRYSAEEFMTAVAPLAEKRTGSRELRMVP